jgi:hypothetical protein
LDWRAILKLSDIEDDDVRVELRSGVPIDGPGRVMLEFRRGKRRIPPGPMLNRLDA